VHPPRLPPRPAAPGPPSPADHRARAAPNRHGVPQPASPLRRAPTQTRNIGPWRRYRAARSPRVTSRRWVSTGLGPRAEAADPHPPPRRARATRGPRIEPALHVPGRAAGDARGRPRFRCVVGRARPGGRDQLRQPSPARSPPRRARTPPCPARPNAAVVPQREAGGRLDHVLILPSQILRCKWWAARKYPGESSNLRRMDRNEQRASHARRRRIWDAHVVRSAQGEPDLLFIDLHIVHEVTSPQAFGRASRGRPEGAPVPTLDHRHRRPQRPDDRPSPVPGLPPDRPELARSPTRSPAPSSRPCARTRPEFGIRLHPMGTTRGQGQSCTLIGPAARPHPAGHDDRLRRTRTRPPTARSARIAFGIGTSEGRARPGHPRTPAHRSSRKTMAINVEGRPAGRGVTAKDLILAIIAQIGTGGGPGLHRRVPRRGDQVAVHGRPQ